MAGSSRRPVDERGYVFPGSSLHKLATKATEDGRVSIQGHGSNHAIKVQKKSSARIPDENYFGGHLIPKK